MITVQASRVLLIGCLTTLIHAVPSGPPSCYTMPTAMAARAQARVHVHRGVVSIVVLGVERAGVSISPGGEVLATV